MPTPLEPPLLLGRWLLARDIDDRAAGERSTVAGTLDLATDGRDAIRWTEDGRWTRAGGVVPVERRLLLRRRTDGWWVLFEDGRDFHPWSPGQPVVHPCRADTYTGLVTGDPGAWSVRWEVTGPGKDYTMTTRLTRG